MWSYKQYNQSKFIQKILKGWTTITFPFFQSDSNENETIKLTWTLKYKTQKGSTLQEIADTDDFILLSVASIILEK